MRTGVRQPRPADHGRRQFGAVADQGRGRLGGRSQAQAAVQPDAAAQDQAARRRRRTPSQIHRRGRPQSTVAGAQIAGQDVAVAGFRSAAAQRTAAELLATGGDGREEQEQLGAKPGRHARVGRPQAGQSDERQAKGAAQTAAKAQNEGRPVVRRRRRGRHRSLRSVLPLRATRTNPLYFHDDMFILYVITYILFV